MTHRPEPDAGQPNPYVPMASGPDTGSPLRRIAAMILRYWYLLRGSWPRILELAYWPTVQMIIWGLITQHLMRDSDYIAQAFGVLIGAVLLWDVLFRGQLGMSLSFLEEMWSRNMGHLFVSPLRPHEWVLAMATMSLLRTLIGVVPAALLAMPFYDYSVFAMGPPLLAFFSMLLMTGWWMALIIIALILRYGLGAESLAWLVVFLFAPVACIYYPIEVLPVWAQWVALSLPPAHVFEGMRGVLFSEGFSWGHFTAALSLNLGYMTAAGVIFAMAFNDARNRGALLQQGE